MAGPQVRRRTSNRWERVALVTDLDSMITVASLFGWMTPSELRRFPLTERAAAIAWAAEAIY
jgi:SpoIIAA-like